MIDYILFTSLYRKSVSSIEIYLVKKQIELDAGIGTPRSISRVYISINDSFKFKITFKNKYYNS